MYETPVVKNLDEVIVDNPVLAYMTYVVYVIVPVYPV